MPHVDSTDLIESIIPNVRETQSVLAYFRQLHAADKLFIRACDAFVATCSDKTRNDWVDDQKRSFKEMIDSPAIPFGEKYSPREIIAMFMYGARLLHSESNRGDDTRLSEFIREQGIHRVSCAFNNSLWNILNYATSTYHVIKRDYDHWLRKCGLAPPTRITIPHLFQNVVADPRTDQ
jgi:hypothetical protein